MPAAAAIPAVVGLAGAGASIYAANKQSDAAKGAAQAQTQAADQTAQVQREMYYTNLGLLKPFITTGSAANREMAQLMGLGGVDLYGDDYPTAKGGLGKQGGAASGQNQKRVWVPDNSGGTSGYYLGNGDTGDFSNDYLARLFRDNPWLADRSLSGRFQTGGQYGVGSGGHWVMQNAGGGNRPNQQKKEPYVPISRAQQQKQAFNRFRASPDYQFRLNEGLDAVEKSAAARGGLLSGAAAKAMNRFAQNTASSEYGNYWNRLSQLAGYGSSMIGQAATLGSNTAGQIGQAYQNAGDARASGYINQANAFTGGLQGVGNSLGYLAGQYGGGYTDTSGLYNSSIINGWS